MRLLFIGSLLLIGACSSSADLGPPADGGVDLSDDGKATGCSDASLPTCGPGRALLCLGGSWVCEGPGVDLAGVDLAACAADLAGTPRQICGIPDASFDPMRCICVGDP